MPWRFKFKNKTQIIEKKCRITGYDPSCGPKVRTIFFCRRDRHGQEKGRRAFGGTAVFLPGGMRRRAGTRAGRGDFRHGPGRGRHRYGPGRKRGAAALSGVGRVGISEEYAPVGLWEPGRSGQGGDGVLFPVRGHALLSGGRHRAGDGAMRQARLRPRGQNLQRLGRGLRPLVQRRAALFRQERVRRRRRGPHGAGQERLRREPRRHRPPSGHEPGASAGGGAAPVLL